MKDFVPFVIAKKLEEKGFKIQGGFQYLYYNEELVKVCDYCNISPYEYAPTISQVLKWLREEKKISIEPTIHCSLKWVSGIYSFDDGLADFTQYEIEGTDDTVFIFFT